MRKFEYPYVTTKVQTTLLLLCFGTKCLWESTYCTLLPLSRGMWCEALFSITRTAPLSLSLCVRACTLFSVIVLLAIIVNCGFMTLPDTPSAAEYARVSTNNFAIQHKNLIYWSERQNLNPFTSNFMQDDLHDYLYGGGLHKGVGARLHPPRVLLPARSLELARHHRPLPGVRFIRVQNIQEF